MSMRTVLTWMHEEDRTVAYLARQTGIEPGRLIDVMADTEPTDDEVTALSEAIGIPAGDLRGGEHTDADLFDPLRCYTVAETAAIMGVSQDTVRSEMRDGTLEHVVIGARSHRIPRWALERRLMGRKGYRDGQGTSPA